MDNPGTQIDSMVGSAGDELRADAVTPAQFYPARRGSASVEPIMRLMGGVLADGVRSYQRNFEAQTGNRRQEFCETLNIDPSRLRELIIRWEKTQRPGDKPRMIRRSAVKTGGRLRSRRTR